MGSRLAALLALITTASCVNFPFESIQLTDAATANFSAIAFGNKSAIGTTTTSACRAFPGTADWPLDAEWAQFNSSIDGALLKPLPPAVVCYPGPSYSLAKCISLLFGGFGGGGGGGGGSSSNSDGRFYIDDPLTVLTSWPQGDTCAPSLQPRGNCTQGGFPVYVVNVTTVKQIQGAVNFARNRNIRLVIKLVPSPRRYKKEKYSQ